MAVAAVLLALTPGGVAHADRIRDDQWHLRFLDIAEAHRHSRGEGVTVAVLDTGVDPHPDLRRNLLPGTDVVPGGTGDGRQDLDSHGTAMAGLVAAHGTGVSTGALGVAPRAKILPIRDRLGASASGPDAMAAGVEWAVLNGATVICIASATNPSTRLRGSIESALRSDVVVVAAAGNREHDYGIAYPASVDGVLAAAAADRQGKHAGVSVPGSKVGLAAPGVDIYSTSVRGEYRRGTGTSGATAIVAGAAALVRSRFPDLSAEEVVHRLTATATDKGPPGRDEQYGYGVLDIVAALTADVPPLAADADPTPTASAVAGPTSPGQAAPPGQPPTGSAGSTRGFAAVAAAVVGGGAALVGLLLLRRRRSAAAGTGGADGVAGRNG